MGRRDRKSDRAMVTSAPGRKRSPRERSLLVMNAAALCLVFLCAFAVIHSTHACRELYATLQVLESSRWSLQEDYGRLLLEQSTWASHYRVERVARSELGMREPGLDQLTVIPR